MRLGIVGAGIMGERMLGAILDGEPGGPALPTGIWDRSPEALARPRLLLVDEPSLGLAPLTTISLLDQFRDLRRSWSLTIVLAEQNAKLTLTVADRAVVLARGNIALDRPAAQLGLEELQASYLGAAGSIDGTARQQQAAS